MNTNECDIKQVYLLSESKLSIRGFLRRSADTADVLAHLLACLRAPLVDRSVFPNERSWNPSSAELLQHYTLHEIVHADVLHVSAKVGMIASIFLLH